MGKFTYLFKYWFRTMARNYSKRFFYKRVLAISAPFRWKWSFKENLCGNTITYQCRKTKSTEIIIRSSFLSERANIVLVAPFRALCNEIKNDLQFSFDNENINVDEFFDVLQVDVEIKDILESENKSIFVLPRKIVLSFKAISCTCI